MLQGDARRDPARGARGSSGPAQLSVVLVGDADEFVKDLKGVGFGDFERIPIEKLDLLSADFQRAADPQSLQRVPE